jgi:dTDP-D-glucose 4,6-dehydratase
MRRAVVSATSMPKPWSASCAVSSSWVQATTYTIKTAIFRCSERFMPFPLG